MGVNVYEPMGQPFIADDCEAPTEIKSKDFNELEYSEAERALILSSHYRELNRFNMMTISGESLKDMLIKEKVSLRII
jgi:hypothetical protein